MTRHERAAQALRSEAQRAQALADARAGRFEQARLAFERALELEPRNVSALVNLGAVHQAMGQFEQALSRYAEALRLEPGLPEAWNNRGLVLLELRRHEEALRCCDLAISLRPDYPEAHNNRGVALQGLGRWNDALASHDAALHWKPKYAKAHHNRGLVLLELGRPAQALPSLERALALHPNAETLHGLVMNTRMKLARWDHHADRVADLQARLMRGELASQPFAVLSLVDSAQLHRQAAGLWAARHHPKIDPAKLPRRARLPGDRIRIGYFSADFHCHATSHLMAGLFEAHDRNEFEIVAFSFGPDDGHPLTHRVRSAFDRFIDVRSLSDVQVALLAREQGIDIAVDLKGYTRDSRPGIFAARAAPIQVGYLGYPGTLGAPLLDYLLADATVIPDGSRSAYTERVIWLPGSYQCNDALRQVADETPSREALGLPLGGAVLACFNHTYKINPEVFDAWTRILRACPGSALWLLEDNAEASQNLRHEAERRGVDPARLVFAPRLAAPEHLARHRQADLFLDTWPYNAHTTASDALWMGVPLVTKIGDSFPSRVAASLLSAAGAAELVTPSIPEYEALAIALAQDPERRRRLGERLLASRGTVPLFQTRQSARHLESAFRQMSAGT